MVHALLMALLLAAPPQASTFTISGTVVREDGQEAATAVQANQIRITGPLSRIIGIGAGGAFEFPNLRPGTYQIVVGPRVTMSPLTVIVADKDVTGLRVLVPLTVDVTGSVTVDGNGPRPRFQIAFTRVGATANPITRTATATFTLPLPAGDYRIAASGLPEGYMLKSATIGGVDALNQPFKIDQGSPAALSIVLGVSSQPPWVRLRGRVVGGAATNVSLSGTPIAETLTTPVGPNGVFEFPMVLPGNYTARVLPAVPLAPPTPVTVASTDVTDLELRIPATKEVSGRITIRGNVPAPRLIFSLANGPAAAPVTGAPDTIAIINGVVTTTAPGTVSIPLNVGPDGFFKITLPVGERGISILPNSIPQGYSVDSFTYGSTDLLKNPIRVSSNDTTEIAITVNALDVKPHTISGKVTGLLNTQGVRVVLQGGNLGTGVESPVAPDGSFSFSNVLPGTYSARLSMSGHIISTAVRVGNSDVTNVTINHPRRFSIGAHVLVEGDTADPPYVPPVTLEARSATGPVVAASTSGNASPLVLTVSDGEHRISVRNLPAGYVLKSIRYGSIDLQKSPLTVDGPITWEIVVRLVKS
jgi:hypothetical protein